MLLSEADNIPNYLNIFSSKSDIWELRTTEVIPLLKGQMQDKLPWVPVIGGNHHHISDHLFQQILGEFFTWVFWSAELRGRKEYVTTLNQGKLDPRHFVWAKESFYSYLGLWRLKIVCRLHFCSQYLELSVYKTNLSSDLISPYGVSIT